MEFHGLGSRRSTSHHGCRTHPAHTCEEVAHRFVGPQPLGWNRHAYFDAIPVRTDDLRDTGVWLDEDVHDDA